MKSNTRRIVRVALLLSAAAALAGCDSIREASGTTKEPPDEFAIVTKAPLIIPPDYNLRPPKPGAAPTNQVEPTQAAQQALIGADNQTIANSFSGNESQGERLLLANAGAQNADPNIRQDLVADETAMQTASDSFTNQILFWQQPSTPGDAGVDADAEAAKLHAAQPAGTATQQPTANTNDSATIDKNEKSDDSGGWFDWF